MKWPTMPPSKGQSPVLFEDGYAEGWAKCLDACQQAYADRCDYERGLRAPRPESPAVREALVEGMRAARDGPRLTADERSAIWRTLDAALQSLPAGPRDASVDPAAALLEVPQAPAGSDEDA